MFRNKPGELYTLWRTSKFDTLIVKVWFLRRYISAPPAVVFSDVRAIWLRHLSPHWSLGLIRLIWLARRVSPSSLTVPCVSLPKLRARWKRTRSPRRTTTHRYTSSCAPLLEPPNKLSRPSCRRNVGKSSSKLQAHPNAALHVAVCLTFW